MTNVIYLTEDFIPVTADDPRMAMVKVRQPDGKVVFGFPAGKVKQNRKLFIQTFEGHRGRPGRRGGSLPRSSSGGNPETLEILLGDEEDKFIKVGEGVREKFEEFKKRGKLDKNLTVEQFARDVYNFEDPETGLSVSIDEIDFEARRGNFIRISGKVLDKDGSYSGHVVRHLYQGSGEIENDLFSLGETFQGKGFGGKFYVHSEEALIKYNVTKVKLFADLDTGGYAWARMGFEFENDLDMKNTIVGAERYWTRTYGATVPFPSRKSKMSPWEIASMKGPSGEAFGKNYLIGQKVSWIGVKTLNPNSRGFKVGEIYYKYKGYK